MIDFEIKNLRKVPITKPNASKRIVRRTKYLTSQKQRLRDQGESEHQVIQEAVDTDVADAAWTIQTVFGGFLSKNQATLGKLKVESGTSNP